MTATAALVTQLEQLEKQFADVIGPLTDEQAIRAAQAQFLGKKGLVSQLMKELGRLPPADRPVVAAMLQPDRYLVTPEPGDDDAAWLASLSTALAAGIRRVQLRARTIDSQPRWRNLTETAVALCRKAGAEALVNGDIELARQLGTGVHLRSTQLKDLSARPLPENLTVAASCHDAEALQLAQALGCDFAVLGSVLPTATHLEANPLGWEGFAKLRESVSLPIYAIGGLSPADIHEARQHGAQGVAAIRALWPPG